MSDEEKKAIEHLTKKMEYHKNKPLDTYVWLTLDEHYVRILLNLIEEQSKEIEELKKEYERVRAGRNWLSEHISAQIATPELFDRLVEENYISKDKIKAKIEEYDDKEMTVNLVNRSAGKTFQQAVRNEVIKVLQSLLERR